MLSIPEITDVAEKAIRANYRVRNQRAFSEKPRQDRLVAERKHQIREWIDVLRVVREPLNHAHVIARVTDRGQFSGRNLMGHALRNRVILGGLDAMIERAKEPQQHQGCFMITDPEDDEDGFLDEAPAVPRG